MGFTAIDNEFFELLPLLSGNELKILLSVIRETYGWHKDSVALKQKNLAEKTGIGRQNLIPSIKTLIQKGFLKKTWGKDGIRYKFIIRVDDRAVATCYEKYTSETCPFKKTNKVEPFCINCPRYLLAKG